MKTSAIVVLTAVLGTTGAIAVVGSNFFPPKLVPSPVVDGSNQEPDEVLKLRPGFLRTSRSISSTSSQKKSLSCYRYDATGEVELFSDDVYGSENKELKLEIEEDLDTPITITVEAINSSPDEKDADPAIEIHSLDGIISTCYDYQHKNEEVLHTSNMNVARRFVPKKGTYFINLWSYYQPARQYKVIISEDR